MIPLSCSWKRWKNLSRRSKLGFGGKLDYGVHTIHISSAIKFIELWWQLYIYIYAHCMYMCIGVPQSAGILVGQTPQFCTTESDPTQLYYYYYYYFSDFRSFIINKLFNVSNYVQVFFLLFLLFFGIESKPFKLEFIHMSIYNLDALKQQRSFFFSQT